MMSPRHGRLIRMILISTFFRLLVKVVFSKPSVEQTRRLGIVSCNRILQQPFHVQQIQRNFQRRADEKNVRIYSFLLDGNARRWQLPQRTNRQQLEHNQGQFNVDYCPPAYKEMKKFEFERLTQDNMTVFEYEHKVQEIVGNLSSFGFERCSQETKVNESITLNISDYHTPYNSP